MQDGNWTPISSFAVAWLPNNRVYTKIEALFSLQVNYYNEQPVTVLGLANLWGWPYRQVSNFLDELNIAIVYPEDTKKRQKQSGKIMKRKPEENEKKKFIFSEDLLDESERKRKETEKKTKTYIKSLKTLESKESKESKETYIPPNFSISENMQAWAAREGYGSLDRHLVWFIDWATSGGKKYKDWEATFRNAVRGNWAKLPPDLYHAKKITTLEDMLKEVNNV